MLSDALNTSSLSATLYTFLADDLAAVQQIMRDRVCHCVPRIQELALHIIDSGGKRIRPLITLACGRLLGPSSPDLIKLAACIELLHQATLLHDDVIDQAHTRRHKICAHLVWDAKSAILVGDYLFATAFELMTEVKNFEVLALLSKTSSTLIAGEVAQWVAVNKIDTSLAAYFDIIQKKTGSLFKTAAQVGALCRGVSDIDRAALQKLGHNLGMAFQLVDDYLDYVPGLSNPTKKQGNDFYEGKMTYPVLWARQKQAQKVQSLFIKADKTPEVFGQIQVFLAESGALSATMSQAQFYCDQALDGLDALPPSDCANHLRAVIKKLARC
jgi:octaprenyl-diphosphate synthase